MPAPMPMQVPQQGGQMMPSPNVSGGQSPMGNPQMFAQLLQQMGAAPPNLQGQGQTPMPGQGMQPGQMPQMGQMSQMGKAPTDMGQGSAGQPGAPGAPPMGAGGPASMPPQMQQMLQQQMMQRMAQTQGGQRMGQPAPQRSFTPQELGALGRMGDTTVAHLTPGEMTVPPEVQTPKVLATLKSEYHKKGVDPSQFTVGSPNSSVNPNTGVPEYNFWASMLPIALSIGGGIFGGPLGAAAGAGIGNLVEGKSLGQSLMAAGMSGIGDFGVGQLVGDGASAVAGNTAGEVANDATGPSGLLASLGIGPDAASSAASEVGPQVAADVAQSAEGQAAAAGSSAYGTVAGTDLASSAAQAINSPGAISVDPSMGASASQPLSGSKNIISSLAPNPAAAAQLSQSSGTQALPSVMPLLGGQTNNIAGTAAQTANKGLLSSILQNGTKSGMTWGNIIGSGLGASMGSSIASANANPPQPTGFNSPYKSAKDLPSWQQQIGQTSYKGPLPQFGGYNPLTNNPAAYNFFPTGT